MVIRTLAASTPLLGFCWTAVAHATPAACSERLLPPPLGAATGQRAIVAEDLIELRDFGTISYGPGREPFSISPDGKFAALTLRRADPRSDSYCVGIVLVPLDGRARPRLLDVGGTVIPATSDVHGIAAIPNGLAIPAAPVWSPDSRTLIFLRRDGKVTQIWRVGLDGRPARRVTRLTAEPQDLVWGDDGHHVQFTTRKSLDAAARGVDREGRSGFLYDERFWTIVNVRPRPRSSLPTETNTLDLTTGALRELSAREVAEARRGRFGDMPAGVRVHARSATGASAWVSPEQRGKPRGATLLRIELDGKPIDCSDPICKDPIVDVAWSSANTLLIMRGGTAENGGRNALYRWDLAVNAKPVLLFETEDYVTGCKIAAGKMICAHEAFTKPRTLGEVDLTSGKWATVFDPNPEFARLRLGPAERVNWTDKDGVRTYGDLVLPPSHKDGERHPLVIVQYSSRGFLRGGLGDEYPIQLLAEHGYAVLSFQMPMESAAAANASSSLSAKRQKYQNWSGRERIFTALDAGVDAVIARGAVDPEAIAITGISDGGSTVQFALNNSSRFKVAIMGGCCDEPSATFTVGPGYTASTEEFGYPRPGDDGREFWRRQSLAQNAYRLRVPLLMHVADNEMRMSAETFMALKSHGVPVEMYVFPDEWHTKSHPAHRLAIYGRNLAWLDFWLRGIVSSDPARASEIARWQQLRERLKRSVEGR